MRSKVSSLTLKIFFLKRTSYDGSTFLLKIYIPEDASNLKDEIRQWQQSEEATAVGRLLSALITTLEPKNDFYNCGPLKIQEYQNMYVTRPEGFLNIIYMIRDFEIKQMNLYRENKEFKEENIDVILFKEALEGIKISASGNYEKVAERSEKFKVTINSIIKMLEKFRDEDIDYIVNQTRIGNQKIQDISIRKLTKKSPSLKEKFDQLKDKT